MTSYQSRETKTQHQKPPAKNSSVAFITTNFQHQPLSPEPQFHWIPPRPRSLFPVAEVFSRPKNCLQCHTPNTLNHNESVFAETFTTKLLKLNSRTSALTYSPTKLQNHLLPSCLSPPLYFAILIAKSILKMRIVQTTSENSFLKY